MPKYETQMSRIPEATIHFVKGRGAGSNMQSRFLSGARDRSEEHSQEIEDDGLPPLETEVNDHSAKTIISRNESPDIGFDQSINPYLGCEHGCIYCYARPTHAYIGLSPGRDFESKIFAKRNAAEALRRELSKPAYAPSVIALGANTDPYQPIERKLGITREVLRVLQEFRAPVSITTKGSAILRDIDIISSMAAQGLARVNISLATMDPELARKLDPRAPSPQRRLAVIKALADAGIPVAVFTSPVIPALTDVDLERILQAAAAAGARYASYVLLRLPLEVRDLFVEWLEAHFPLRAQHVMSLVAQSHNGRDYDSSFGQRMRGAGVHADLIAQRFKLATRRFGLNQHRLSLDTTMFVRRVAANPQQSLF